MPETPIRFRKLRSDAHLRSVVDTLEKTLDLPPGSIHLVKPNGKRMRSDATVGSLREAWEE